MNITTLKEPVPEFPQYELFVPSDDSTAPYLTRTTKQAIQQAAIYCPYQTDNPPACGVWCAQFEVVSGSRLPDARGFEVVICLHCCKRQLAARVKHEAKA